jgi:hypothetical protein
MNIVFTQKQKAISVFGPSRCVPTDLGRPHGQLAILNIYQQEPLYLQYILYKYTYNTLGGGGLCSSHCLSWPSHGETQVRLVSQSKEDTVI